MKIVPNRKAPSWDYSTPEELGRAVGSTVDAPVTPMHLALWEKLKGSTEGLKEKATGYLAEAAAAQLKMQLVNAALMSGFLGRH